MDFKLIDSTGKEYGVKVDSENRAHVDAVSKDTSINAALNGESYNINSGSITLTTGNESGVIYLKNNEEKHLVIKEIIVIVGSSTGGSGEGEVKIVKNPSTGTLITAATNASIVENRNFSSSRELEASVYRGIEGATVTNGDTFATTTRSAFPTVITFDASAIVLAKGNSIAVNFTPPTSNTSQSIKIAITAYLI